MLLASCLLCTASFANQDSPQSIHNEPRTQQEPSITCANVGIIISLESEAVARTAGFEYSKAKVSNLTRKINRNAELVYDANRYARLSSRASGIIVEVRKDLGEFVAKGETIALIDSIELGNAKADLVEADELFKLWQENADREHDLMNKGASTARQALEAKTRLVESKIAASRAKQRLRNLGLTTEDIAMILSDGETGSLLAIISPFDGTLVERSAVIGEVVDLKDTLFAVADTSVMWAMIDLNEADLASVKRGQRMSFHIDSVPSKLYTGQITWISTQLDHRTRTIHARAELNNESGVLKAFMFGRATVFAGRSSKAVTIPKSAVHWEGCCNVVFVKSNPQGTAFTTTQVTLGFDTGVHYEVINGLNGGEEVVTTGSFILKNEILKESMGAGCCEVDFLSK